MVSKTSSKIKTFWKISKGVFRSRSSSDRADSSKVEAPNQGPNTSPAAEIPTSTANTPKPAAVRLEISDQSEAEKDGQQVQEYEELLSRELQASAGWKNGTPIDRPHNSDESLIKIENQINSTNPKIRLAQLEAITSSGLQQLDEKRTRYFIFGHKFTLRGQVTQAAQFIQNIKRAIDGAVKASPQASLAWAGVSVILPILMNPSVAEEVSRDGCLYITSRMQFYLKLESLLLPNDEIQASGLDIEFEDRLIALYRQIIDFQIRTVRRIYLTRLARFAEDALQHEDWEGLLARIQASETTLASDLRQANDAVMAKELEKLNNNAEKWFADNSALVALLKGREASTRPVPNNGPGTWQFIATGGTQNNMTGSGINFSGATFSAPVYFNMK